MPTTAFSNYFRRELDVGQLARLILQDTPDAAGVVRFDDRASPERSSVGGGRKSDANQSRHGTVHPTEQASDSGHHVGV